MNRIYFQVPCHLNPNHTFLQTTKNFSRTLTSVQHAVCIKNLPYTAVWILPLSPQHWDCCCFHFSWFWKSDTRCSISVGTLQLVFFTSLCGTSTCDALFKKHRFTATVLWNLHSLNAFPPPLLWITWPKTSIKGYYWCMHSSGQLHSLKIRTWCKECICTHNWKNMNNEYCSMKDI